MNYIKHLTGFFDKVAIDRELNPTHISLYMALFQFWNCNRFRNPISISRDELMKISKISSKATYHKCLKNLHSLSYIKYEPSYNPFKGSHVYLFNFSEGLKPILKKERMAGPNFELALEQLENKSKTTSGTTNEQALVSYINNINNTNKQKGLNTEKNAEQSQNFEKDNLFVKEKKMNTGKEEINTQTIEEVIDYFQAFNFPKMEANKFFNYFSSIGWLVGGKTPMIDWKASAQNWMLNADKFKVNEKQISSKHLSTITEKDYSEPL
jgi:hypothetical protein